MAKETKYGKMARKRMVNRISYVFRMYKKQFQRQYSYSGADLAKQALIKRMLLRNCGMRDIEAVLEVSRGCLHNNLEKNGSQIAIKS